MSPCNFWNGEWISLSPGHMFHGLPSLVLCTVTLVPYIREAQEQWEGNHPKAAALEVLDLVLRRTMDGLCSSGTTRGRGMFLSFENVSEIP